MCVCVMLDRLGYMGKHLGESPVMLRVRWVCFRDPAFSTNEASSLSQLMYLAFTSRASSVASSRSNVGVDSSQSLRAGVTHISTDFNRFQHMLLNFVDFSNFNKFQQISTQFQHHVFR